MDPTFSTCPPSTSSSTTSRPIRVLALPGYGTNAKHMEGKLKQARIVWGDDMQLTYLEPPHLLSIPTLPDTGAPRPPPDASLPAGATENARYWWPWAQHRHYERGVLESLLVYLRAFFEREGSFDAAIGFSQGSATIVLLLALLERPHLHPIWAAPPRDAGVEWPPAPFKCAVLCSAFGPGDPRYQRWYKEEKPRTPTLHLIGRNDVVANPQHSLDTVARLHNPTVVWHDGGHHIPRRPYFAHLIKEFVTAACDDDKDWGDERRDGWGSPTESVASSIGEGNVYFPAVPLSPILEPANL
ncbi:hypothetical protein JCM11641_006829 [Rhodosporidiobolus odoratus]